MLFRLTDHFLHSSCNLFLFSISLLDDGISLSDKSLSLLAVFERGSIDFDVHSCAYYSCTCCQSSHSSVRDTVRIALGNHLTAQFKYLYGSLHSLQWYLCSE